MDVFESVGISAVWPYLLWVAAAYLLGSVSLGDVVARVAGFPIRIAGTGNPGTANVFREMGARYADRNGGRDRRVFRSGPCGRTGRCAGRADRPGLDQDRSPAWDGVLRHGRGGGLVGLFQRDTRRACGAGCRECSGEELYSVWVAAECGRGPD